MEEKSQVNTAEKDMPDCYSRVVPNALWTLIEVLSSIRDVNGKILIEGLYDRVRAIGAEKESCLSNIFIIVYLPLSDTRCGPHSISRRRRAPPWRTAVGTSVRPHSLAST